MLFALSFLCLPLSTFALVLEPQCGRPVIKPNVTLSSNLNSMIVGGNAAVPHSWPWQCRTNGCGCTVIGKNWVLTASHCVVHGKMYTVFLGLDKLSNKTKSVKVKAKAIIYQPNWIHDLFPIKRYLIDLALLQVEEPIKFGPDIQPVCLAKDDTAALSPGTKCVVTGWGDLLGNGTYPDALQQVVVNMQEPEKCRAVYKPPDFVAELFTESVNVCASAPHKDACGHDSGGPLVEFDKQTNRWFQYGIVSWGKGCALPNYPGVYVRVTPFCNWIQSATDVKCV